MDGIATLTLNAALDRTLHVDGFVAGRKSRVLQESAQAGGKGVNVARVLRALGVPTRALVVVGGPTGRAIAADLERSGIPADCIAAPGESRTCLEIVEPGGRATQLHAPGVEGGGALLDAVLRALDALPAGFGWLALCGSLPPGMAPDAARRLVEAARERGLRVAVDAAGPALAAAWSADPDLVRINAAELASVLPAEAGEPLPYASLGAAARVVVSRGARRFEAWAEGTSLLVTPPAVATTNPIGCGDAMMAGLLASLARGSAFASALRVATALAAAQAASLQAGRPDLARAPALEPDVRIETAREGPK